MHHYPFSDRSLAGYDGGGKEWKIGGGSQTRFWFYILGDTEATGVKRGGECEGSSPSQKIGIWRG